jgi:hypothetical protein
MMNDKSFTSATRLISPKHTTFHISTDNEDKTFIFFLVIMFSSLGRSELNGFTYCQNLKHKMLSG